MAIRDWAERNREFVIIFISFVIITLLSVVAMNISGSKDEDKEDKEPKAEVVAADASDTNDSSKDSSQKPERPSTKNVGGYFTEISPESIIAQAHIPSALSPLPKDPEEVQMPVGWFVYFSQAYPSEENLFTVTLDTDKNGFGTVIVCEVDLTTFPQFRSMETGKKIWVAGHIKNISLEGTGTINLEPDHFRFDGNTHVALFPDEG